MPCKGADAWRQWQQGCRSAALKTCLLLAHTPADPARTLQSNSKLCKCAKLAQSTYTLPHTAQPCHTP